MRISLERVLRAIRSSGYVVNDKGPKGIDGRVVTYCDSSSQIAEQYRMLLTHINTLKSEKGIKTVMITSSLENDGKTVTCCNLAAAIASIPNKKSVLVDCDLRKPQVHKLFNIPASPGVSDIFEGKCKLSDVLKTPIIGSLYLLPAGTETQHPSDALRSRAVKDIFETLRSSFDYVIIDTPPTLPVTDSRILGNLCDAVILVVRYDKTVRKSIKDAFSLLKISNATPVACVLVDFRSPVYSYRRYSPHYYRMQTKK